jgi:hypothetical protein
VVASATSRHPDGRGVPPSSATRSARIAAAVSTSSRVPGGSVVRDSTLTTPTTRPSTVTGAQTSAEISGSAARKCSHSATSTTAVFPVCTTWPTMPASTGMPESTCQYPRDAWQCRRPDRSK